MDRAGHKVRLPVDVVTAPELSLDAPRATVPIDAIADDQAGYDIGPLTGERFSDEIAAAGTVLWNGPMGVFELPPFAEGTHTIAAAVARSSAFIVVGGGDSIAAVDQLGIADRVDHASTGGGAMLELLEGKTLPGLAVLER